MSLKGLYLQLNIHFYLLQKEFIDKLAHEIKIAFCQGDLEEANKSAKELGKILNEGKKECGPFCFSIIG